MQRSDELLSRFVCFKLAPSYYPVLVLPNCHIFIFAVDRCLHTLSESWTTRLQHYGDHLHV